MDFEGLDAVPCGIARGAVGRPDQNLNPIIARTGNIAIHTTSIPGVLLANNEPGQQDPRMAQASGILLGPKRDIHLDSGTRVVIGVASASNVGQGGGQ